MGKRANSFSQGREEADLCANVSRLSLEPVEAQELPRDVDSIGLQRLEWYDKMLPFVARYQSSILDWKAWANCGACLYQLGEKKASWDAYKSAALALRSYEVDVNDSELLVDPQVGKYLTKLDREFRMDGWVSNEADDVYLFAVLALRGRASELATQRWNEILPNHCFAVSRALCRKLSSNTQLVQEVCVDTSRMYFQQGNFLALLGSAEGLYVESESKRAKLLDCVRDICVRVEGISRVPILDFEVEEVEQPDDAQA